VKRFFLVGMLSVLLSSSPRLGGAFDAPNIPDAGQSVPGALAPAPGAKAQITTHKGEWSVFASMQGDAEPIFLITGKLKNISAQPLAYVKMQFELLDPEGVVIVRDYGYNRQAEALREEAYESGKKTLKEMAIPPLKAGVEESFRFLFFKTDIPEFHSYRIRIMETPGEVQP
jgi:hypothetical protein